MVECSRAERRSFAANGRCSAHSLFFRPRPPSPWRHDSLYSGLGMVCGSLEVVGQEVGVAVPTAVRRARSDLAGSGTRRGDRLVGAGGSPPDLPRAQANLKTPKPALLTFVNFGCVHPNAPTRMPADTALAVHDRGCSLQGPSHGLSDLAEPASGAACPSQWQLASYVIMMPAPAASDQSGDGCLRA